MIRRSFVSCLDTLLDQGSRVAITTHDGGSSANRSFHGIARPAPRVPDAAGGAESRADGSWPPATRSASTCPYGQQWYEYSLRRLQENPQMAGVIAKATLARAIGRG